MRLLILGAGNMAANHVREFRLAGAEIVAAADVRADRLAAFVTAHGLPRGFATLDEALAWGDFDAVANVTPDAAHAATSLAAIRAGKHVFCEKPLATNAADAREMAAGVERAGVIGMINLSYRNVPELQEVRRLVDAGAIGEVRHVDAAYLQSWLVARMWGDWRDETTGLLWKLSREHGSNGVLGDLGVHLVDLATFGSGQKIVAISGRLATFPKDGRTRFEGYNLDANDSFALSARFANGAIGTLQSTRWATGHANSLNLGVYGDRGGIEFHHGTDGTTLRICRGDDIDNTIWRDVNAPSTPSTYQRFVTAATTRRPDQPDFRYGAAVQQVLDVAAAADAAADLSVDFAGDRHARGAG